MKKLISLAIALTLLILSCKQKTTDQNAQKESYKTSSKGITFHSSNKKLEEAFRWAKEKALSFAHEGKDSVGQWYEAALPNREAFCMRDVSHQVIGAELLGLSDHNFNMFLKFAENVNVEKDYCSYWEINRYNLPAPEDYESDKDFWYNLPANFDVVYNAHRLYDWTGNKAYLKNKELQNFYSLSMNEYVDHWDLSHTEVLTRNRWLYEEKKDNKRFDGKRGIPTYNEGGRGETVLGIDLTASLIAGYKAAAQISELNGDLVKSKLYADKAKEEENFLNNYWWDADKNAFRSILYDDGTFDHFMVGNDQAFLHYLLYFDVLSAQDKINGVVNAYAENYDKLIVELKSYLPIIFYENGQTALANQMVINLSNVTNARRDYPENSFTIIEHITRGLLGINVQASSGSFTTVSRVEKEEDWVELQNIPILSNEITVHHEGASKSTVTNLKGPTLKWSAQIFGKHEFLYVNGKKIKSHQINKNGKFISSVKVQLKEGDKTFVSITP